MRTLEDNEYDELTARLTTLEEERDQARRLFIAAVISKGDIIISRREMSDANNAELDMWEEPGTGTVIYRIKEQ